MGNYISPFFEDKLHISNYGILMAVGILSAIIMFWALCKYLKISDKVYNFYSMNILISIVAGLGFAWLFQAIYNVLSGRSFLAGGITFMGGLIGGVAVFILATVLFAQPVVKHDMPKIIGIAAPCIALGHFFGRLGCFCAGCCYGVTVADNNPLGVIFKEGAGAGVPRLPTQLIEAFFLLLLFAVLLTVLLKRKDSKFLMISYMFAYSIFRFIIEFWRGDSSRAYFAAISPSQIQSIIMFLGAIALLVVVYVFKKVPYANTGIVKNPDADIETTETQADIDTQVTTDKDEQINQSENDK